MFSCLAPLTWGHHRGYRHLIFLSILPSQLQLQMYLLNPLPPALGPSRLQSLVEADSRRSHQKTFPGQEEEQVAACLQTHPPCHSNPFCPLAHLIFKWFQARFFPLHIFKLFYGSIDLRLWQLSLTVHCSLHCLITSLITAYLRLISSSFSPQAMPDNGPL